MSEIANTEDEVVDILLVDDQPAGLMALEATLTQPGVRLHKATSGAQALRQVLAHDFALILLDVLMPSMDGFETGRLIRERERSSRTPIIFLTAISDETVPKSRAYAMGAVDYMVKPLDTDVLRSKVAVFVELARKTAQLRRQSQQLHEAQQKHHERELTRTREEFFAIALHELRTPLTSMSIQMHGLQRWLSKATGPIDAKDVSARVAELQGGMARLNRLSDYLLDVSRMRAGKLTLERAKVDLAEVVRALVTPAQPVEVTVTVNGPTLGFWDKARLEQVISNLVSNAVKYGNGKPVSVGIEGSETDDGVTLSVRDEGLGIAKDDLEHIFSRFFRGTQSTEAKGFGLGLWIVEQLVALHGGTVAVQSELGKGSTFTVKVPRNLAGEQATSAAPSAGAASVSAPSPSA